MVSSAVSMHRLSSSHATGTSTCASNSARCTAVNGDYQRGGSLGRVMTTPSWPIMITEPFGGSRGAGRVVHRPAAKGSYCGKPGAQSEGVRTFSPSLEELRFVGAARHAQDVHRHTLVQGLPQSMVTDSVSQAPSRSRPRPRGQSASWTNRFLNKGNTGG